MSVTFVYRQKMDFSICAHKVGFCKFNHICEYVHLIHRGQGHTCIHICMYKYNILTYYPYVSYVRTHNGFKVNTSNSFCQQPQLIAGREWQYMVPTNFFTIACYLSMNKHTYIHKIL